MSALADNERVKFQAAALDRASTACFAIGVLGPVIAQGGLAAIVTPLAWLAMALALHVWGYLLLGRLRS